MLKKKIRPKFACPDTLLSIKCVSKEQKKEKDREEREEEDKETEREVEMEKQEETGRGRQRKGREGEGKQETNNSDSGGQSIRYQTFIKWNLIYDYQPKALKYVK